MSEQLRALALAATKGPWTMDIGEEGCAFPNQWPTIQSDDREVIGTEGFYGDLEEDKANAAFVAAANPAAILALLDELEDSHKAYALLFNECVKFRSALEEIKVKLITDDPLDMYDTVCDVLTPVGAAKGESNAD
jgi:hypothetical protein